MTLAILALFFAAVPFVAPALSQPGTWHGDEVDMRNGEKVLVLVERSRLHCELVEQRVRVRRVKDEISDGGNEKTGKNGPLFCDQLTKVLPEGTASVSDTLAASFGPALRTRRRQRHVLRHAATCTIVNDDAQALPRHRSVRH